MVTTFGAQKRSPPHGRIMYRYRSMIQQTLISVTFPHLHIISVRLRRAARVTTVQQVIHRVLGGATTTR